MATFNGHHNEPRTFRKRTGSLRSPSWPISCLAFGLVFLSSRVHGRSLCLAADNFTTKLASFHGRHNGADLCPHVASTLEIVFLIIGALCGGFLVFTILVGCCYDLCGRMKNGFSKKKSTSLSGASRDQVGLDTAPYDHQHHQQSNLTLGERHQSSSLPSYDTVLAIQKLEAAYLKSPVERPPLNDASH